jgi:AI-2 transport protein TqsA
VPPSLSSTSQAVLVFAALVIIVAGIKAAEAIVVPLLLSIFISIVAAGPMRSLQNLGVPTWAALILILLFLLGALSVVAGLVIRSANSLAAEWPTYEAVILEWVAFTLDLLRPYGIDISLDAVREQLDPSTALAMAGNLARGLGSALSNGLFIMLTVGFILMEGAGFPEKLRAVLQNPDRDLPHFFRIVDTVNHYMGIKTLISLITGLLAFSLTAALGIDFPVLWGLLAFLLNFVPTIGSIIAGIPPVLVAFIQLGPWPAVITAGGYLTLNLVMGNLIEPRYMGRGLGLSVLVVFLSLIFWGWVLGPVGMLLSVPLTMAAKIALEANPGTRHIAVLLGPAGTVGERLSDSEVDEISDSETEQTESGQSS